MKRHLPLLALLVVPTCASLPAASVTLPAFPIAVPTIRGWVPVTVVDGLQCNAKPAYGCYHYGTRNIEIDAALSPLLRWRVLRHEMVHAALDAAGVKFDHPEEENYVAEAVAVQQTLELVTHWPR